MEKWKIPYQHLVFFTVAVLFSLKGIAAVPEDPIQMKLAVLEQEVSSLKNDIAQSKTNESTAHENATNNPLTDQPITTKKNDDPTSTTTPSGSNSQHIAAQSAEQNTVNLSTPATNILPNDLPTGWLGPDIRALMVGAASAGFSAPKHGESAFNILDFNPLFLVSYQDFFLLTSSLDFTLDDEGDTEVSLDTLNINLFANNYLIIEAGKMDSGIGKFVQNLSPSWINRLPTAPPGFDSDEAAPQSEIGLQLQGGYHLFGSPNMEANYTFFVENAPITMVDTINNFIDHVDTDGALDNHGDVVVGGRLGFLPIPKLEIGFSVATGQSALVNIDDPAEELQGKRKYNVIDSDLTFQPGNWDFRGEYVRQQINHDADSNIPQGGKWTAWYLQAAYWIPTTKFEPVIRYGHYEGSLTEEDQIQWAYGIDYWFEPSIGLQAAYEVNNGQKDTDSDNNLFLIQLVIGF